MTSADLDSAYLFCQQLANSHYENFPVASILLPKRLRRPISVIYAFARTADDFADEGNAEQQFRLKQLENYSLALEAISNDSYQDTDPIFIALSDVITRHKLPLQLFHDLLSAFKQDVVKNRYANFAEVLDYCTRSANPVGRLLLHLNGTPCQQQLEQSDSVCTALQLINFYQDIEQDYREQDRIYIPLDELSQAGLTETDLIQPDSQKIAPLIRSLYQRAQYLMGKGYSLGTALTGRMGWEVRAMTLGGISTLALLIQQDDTMLLQRPRLNKTSVLKLLSISMSKHFYIKKTLQLLSLK